MSAKHVASIESLLQVWLDGAQSGAGTMLAAYGMPETEALERAEHMVRSIQADPIACEAIRDSIKARLDGRFYPMQRHDVRAVKDQ